MSDDTEIERLEKAASRDDVKRIKVQRDNALLDMERIMNERDALVKALEFYADPSRYNGPNQRLVGEDPYTPKDQGYRRDVMRDNGDIARDALATVGRMRGSP